MKHLNGRARTLGEEVTASLPRRKKAAVKQRRSFPGKHLWKPKLYAMRIGDITGCACGLRLLRIRHDGKHRFEALNGTWPSLCTRRATAHMGETRGPT